MRTPIFSATVAAALAVTAWSPRDAQAQIIFYPQVNSSPYVNPVNYTYPVYSSGFNYPSYSYYNWNTPYSSLYGSSYNYPGYTGYNNYYGYGGRYRGWRRW
jgi:hypothetical protein